MFSVDEESGIVTALLPLDRERVGDFLQFHVLAFVYGHDTPSHALVMTAGPLQASNSIKKSVDAARRSMYASTDHHTVTLPSVVITRPGGPHDPRRRRRTSTVRLASIQLRSAGERGHWFLHGRCRRR